jgi:hypothetical protein
MPGAILDRVLGALEKAGIPCMLTGSFAGGETLPLSAPSLFVSASSA